jgi:hypothetical protein
VNDEGIASSDPGETHPPQAAAADAVDANVKQPEQAEQAGPAAPPLPTPEPGVDEPIEGSDVSFERDRTQSNLGAVQWERATEDDGLRQADSPMEADSAQDAGAAEVAAAAEGARAAEEARQASELAAQRDAAAMTKDVLRFLGVTRVFFVDDRARPPGDADAQAVVSNLRDGILAPERLMLLAEPTIPIEVLTDAEGVPYDAETAALNLETWLGDADPATVTLVVQAQQDALQDGPPEASDPDAVAVEKVRGLIPAGIVFEALLPSEWEAKVAGSSVVQRQGKQQTQPKTLVLFDQDLSQEPGYRPEQGEEMLAQLVAGPDGGNCYAALVSHNISVAEETQRWRALAQQRSVDEKRFTVIGKRRLVDDPVEFARRLRAMLLAPRLWEMAQAVAEAFEAAVKEAHEQLLGLSLPAMEQALLGSAVAEGVWEPDLVLRLLQAQVRDTVQAQLRSSQRLHELVAELRAAAKVRRPRDGADPEELWRVQRHEAYMSFQHLENLRLPLEPGDILRLVSGAEPPEEWQEVHAGDAYVIVTEQDCDLQVRKNGRRNRNPQQLSVVPITTEPTEARDVFTLPWFCPSTGSAAFAQLSRERQLPALALDLACMGAGGYASHTLGESPAETLIPTWAKRHEVLSGQVKELMESYERLANGTTDEAAEHILRSLTLATTTTELALSVDESGTLRFGLQRVGRLLPPWRTDLMQQLSNLRQRVAYEGDLDGN